MEKGSKKSPYQPKQVCTSFGLWGKSKNRPVGFNGICRQRAPYHGNPGATNGYAQGSIWRFAWRPPSLAWVQHKCISESYNAPLHVCKCTPGDLWLILQTSELQPIVTKIWMLAILAHDPPAATQKGKDMAKGKDSFDQWTLLLEVAPLQCGHGPPAGRAGRPCQLRRGCSCGGLQKQGAAGMTTR